MISKGQISVELQQSMGDDNCVANAAWTSSLDYQSKKTKSFDDVKKVIELLATHKHSVPFESVVFRFWIRMPIAIDRQYMTHRLQCLSGDNYLYFDLPKGGARGRRIFRMKLYDFINKWNHGVVGKNHKNRLKRMRLRSINEETGEIYHTNVEDVMVQGKKPVFEFQFENGYKIKSTLNHKYLTDKGWMTIGEALSLNSELMETPKIFNTYNSFSVNGINAYKDYNYMLQLRNKTLSVQEMADDMNISYHTVRKWLKVHGLQFKKEDTYFKKGMKPWNLNLRYKHNRPYNISNEERARKSKAASGERSNFWKGGKTSNLAKERRECTEKLSKVVFARDNYECTNCSSKHRLNAHHIVPIYADNSKILDIDNLTTLCETCHKYIHANHLEEEFAKTKNIIFKKKKPKGFGKKLVRTFSKVTKVTYIGLEETYDIEVKGPYKNFVCNGVVVHNSANGLSGRYRTVPTEFLDIPDDVEEICKKIPQGDKVELLDGSTVVYGMDDIFNEYYDSCIKSNNVYTSVNLLAKDAWKRGLITNPEYKRVREFYRGVLPQHNMTERVSTINLRSFANFIKLRLKPEAQPEIQIVAELMLEEVKNKAKCPIAIEWLIKNNWNI